MSKIGIMGGTFNPVHFGHIEIANTAKIQYGLDEVWFMPNHIPEYKDEDVILSGHHRMNMIKLAIAGYPYFKSSDFELIRDGHTYTSETLPLLSNIFPKDNFYFIMGSDSLFNFTSWKNPEVILEYASILVAQRYGQSEIQIRSKIKELNQYYSVKSFHFIESLQIRCSSSEIRNLLKNQMLNPMSSIKNNSYLIKYLPESVIDYIIKYNLYI